MKKGLCGVLNNEAIMVSFKGWQNEQGRYPFEKMKKIDYSNEVEGNRTSMFQEQKNGDIRLDLFSVPRHVNNFIADSLAERKTENKDSENVNR